MTTFEQSLALYASPTLAFLKPASLFSFHKNESKNIYETLACYNQKFKHKNIVFTIVGERKHHFLIYVYQINLLKQYLMQDEVSRFLLKFEYYFDTLSSALERLKTRLLNDDFPHEIGIFLGYPLKDVIAFIENKGKNCLTCGYWKVYYNQNKAEQIFRRYHCCKYHYLNQLKKGNDIIDIIYA